MKRKSYSETHSKWVYDWPQILDDLEAGLYDNEQKREVWRAAANWVTCACGNQCDALPRNFSGRPEDYRLADLGIEFWWFVKQAAFAPSKQFLNEAIRNARQTLAKIEARAAELLREMGK